MLTENKNSNSNLYTIRLKCVSTSKIAHVSQNIFLKEGSIAENIAFGESSKNINYDLLVSNPTKQIKSLISWLGWKWDDNYLTPHLNPRSVSTASNIQVRSPINTKSLRGWQKYKKMLKPAMEIITKKEKYKDLKY